MDCLTKAKILLGGINKMAANDDDPGSAIYAQVDTLHTARALLAGCIAICRDNQGVGFANEIDRITMLVDKAVDDAIGRLDDIAMGLRRS